MLSNDLIPLLFSCFFVYVNPNSTAASDRKYFNIQEPNSTYEQEPHILHEGSYLIIGVFEQEKNAQQLVYQAFGEGLEAHYSLHTDNGLFYVYTYRDSSKTDILQAYYKVRTNTSYKDAWILTVQPTSELSTDKSEEKPQETDQETAESPQTEKTPHLLSESMITSEPKFVLFKAVNSKTGETIHSDIQVFDSQRNKRIEPVEVNKNEVFDMKALALDTLQVRGRAIGYRVFERETKFNDLIYDPDATTTYYKNDTLFVQLALEALEAGDIQIMYNTYFYGNSTVMRIQSKYELDEVYTILETHPYMKIKLHGHTNGNSRGVAYLYLEEAKNFFELIRTKEYQKKGVSSTILSAYRAETIKSYLTHRGIASERIETIGWGGKKMIYDPDSPMAKNNIRVEIEVLSK